MRTDWLDDLIALLDAGGVAEAARRRNVTQPAFSRRIKTLETVLGFDIIDRTVKPSGPSAVLRTNAMALRKLATTQRSLLSDMRAEHISGARQVVVACQHAISTSFGPHLVEALTTPGDIHVRLRSANRDRCETMLLARQADIALLYRIAADPVDPAGALMLETTIGQDRLVPVAKRETAAQLMWQMHQGALHVISYPQDVFLGDAMAQHIFPRLSSQCRFVMVSETGLTTAALQLAQAGLGVAWVPAALAQPALARGELVDLHGDLGHVDLDIWARRWKATSNQAVIQSWDKLMALTPA